MPAARRTGLDVLAEMPWGTHFCLFYETKPDLLDILLPYYRAGLELNEQCIWVLSRDDPLSREEAWTAIAQFLGRSRSSLQKNIEIWPYQEFFLEDGALKIDRALGRLQERLQRALSAGKQGIRFNGGSAWLLHDSGPTGEWGDFIAFEHALDNFIAERPLLVLCNFPVRQSTAANMLDAAHTHHFSLARRRGAWNSIQVASARPQPQKLTPREIEVLTWTAKGKSAREVAQILHIAKRTVDAHIQHAAEKLGADNKTQAVVLALLRHVIEV